MTIPSQEIDLAPLAALVAAHGGADLAGAPLRAAAMPGGASTRRYFRVELPGGGTAVGMFVPDGARPEEADNADASRVRRWPFLEVAELLSARGVDVPRLYAEDTARGWVLLEDLGDDTLAAYLSRAPGERVALYTRAVSDLARAQHALADLPAGSVVRERAFDEDLLAWELHHFREWGLEARGVTLGAADRELFDRVVVRLARRIAAWPRGFVHRDYQSRNLMVRPARTLAWIDFQDALLGPRVYDLVALLNDSYQTFDRAFVEARLDDYAAASGLGAGERAELGREFDLVTVQRKLKDAGRFVFIDRVKKNPAFLPFVEPTMVKVRQSLERLAPEEPDLADLRDLLGRVLR